MSLTKQAHERITIPYLRELLCSVDDFLDDHYLFRYKRKYQGWFGRLIARLDREEAEQRERNRSGEKYDKPVGVLGSLPFGLEERIEEARWHQLRNSFSFFLQQLIESKGQNAVSVYKSARIDRKLFSKIKTNPYYIPSKKTVLALAIALELDLEETQALLEKAGFSLSDSILSDVIIEFFITHGNYNLDELNAALYAYDQAIF